MTVSRRAVLAAGGGAVVASAAAAITSVFKDSQINDDRKRIGQLQATNDGLRSQVTRLSYNTASGGGVNLKMMPDPVTGEATVPLEEVFSFDRNHAMCRVDTNPGAFKMQTHQMGEVLVPSRQFFMSMVATTIDQFAVSTQSDGMRRVTMRGGLSCKTEVGLATVTVGSRTAAEHATYQIEGIDSGVGGGTAGDRFAFTVFFDPKEAPVNHRIFGPKFTFTGRMVEGKITVVDPKG